MRASEVIAALADLVEQHGDPVIYARPESACGCCLQACEPVSAPAYVAVTQDTDRKGWML